MASLGAKEKSLQFEGLTSAEVEARRRQFGANVLTPPMREPWWKLYLEKFDDPVIRILIIAAVIAIGVGIVEGHFAEGVGILVAVFLATTLAFLNEYKANREFDILNQVSDDVPIKVVRGGKFTTVPRKDLVVDDVVLIETGEECPADGELLEAVSLQIDESRLTGESAPATKRVLAAGEPRAETDTAYAENRLLRSCMVADGHGVFRVTAIGDGTEIGKTARAAAEATGEQTPLNRQLERLSKLIGVCGFGVAGILFVALIGRGVFAGELVLDAGHWIFTAVLFTSVMVALIHVWLPILYDALELLGKEAEPPEWLEEATWKHWMAAIGLGIVLFAVGTVTAAAGGWISSSPGQWLPGHAAEEFLMYFMVAVTLIVVAVPEGLAMSVTLSLAYSMRKMTATNNLVRRMHACETIGAATVICSDKTGTLTLNEMHVHSSHFPSLNGNGESGEPSPPGPQHDLVAESIAVNSTANLSREAGEAPRPLGNPTEGAMLLWLEQQNVDYLILRSAFPIQRQWTFSTERKFMATLGKSPSTGHRMLHVKGAPEILLDRTECISTAAGVEPLGDRRAEIEAQLRACQQRGMRTLALAYRQFPDDLESTELDELAYGLTWLGFVAIHDPIRPEVPPAVRACREAGIQVKIVTGDNPQTAEEIARQIGLLEGDDVSCHLTGHEFAELDDEQARQRADDIHILSRARPLDKMRLVRLLQEKDHVVAVTGDGTNDAPALNYASVGLSMGRCGTAVAKEASDIVLLDDSFRSIVNAVMWGRSLYENIQRFILFQLTINVAALGIAFLGPFIGVKLPLTVTQMLWVNLIMDTFAALALATEPPHWSVMRRRPRNPEDFIVTRPMARFIFGVAGVFLVALVAVLLLFQRVDFAPGLVINTSASPAAAAEVTAYELTVFYTFFVLLQFWNLFNARCLGNRQSALVGMTKNRGFVFIAAAILLGQILIVQFAGAVFRTVPLSLYEWAVLLATTSLVLWCGELWRLWQRRNSQPAPAAIAELA